MTPHPQDRLQLLYFRDIFTVSSSQSCRVQISVNPHVLTHPSPLAGFSSSSNSMLTSLQAARQHSKRDTCGTHAYLCVNAGMHKCMPMDTDACPSVRAFPSPGALF